MQISAKDPLLLASFSCENALFFHRLAELCFFVVPYTQATSLPLGGMPLSFTAVGPPACLSRQCYQWRTSRGTNPVTATRGLLLLSLAGQEQLVCRLVVFSSIFS